MYTLDSPVILIFMERHIDINSINSRALQLIRELSISIAEFYYSIK